MAIVFSIIIPVYNVEPYLRACLDSVRHQTYTEWEAICVNDGSTDGSEAIVREYAAADSRIKLINRPNSGTAAARNTGLKEAIGDYIFFLDSDDWLETFALQRLADQLKGEDILCFSGKRYFESTGSFNQPDRLPERSYQSGMAYYNENALLPRDFAFVCVVLRVYNRLFLMRNSLFFEEDVSFEDNLWVPEVLYFARSVKVMDDSLYLYRIRSGSKMHDLSLSRKMDMMKVANRLAVFFIPKTGFEKRTVYRAITHHYQVALKNASGDDRKKIRSICDWNAYRRVSCTKPRHIFNYWINKLDI